MKNIRCLFLLLVMCFPLPLFASNGDEKVLVLPIFSEDGDVTIWDEDNYWFMAWRMALEANPNPSIILPFANDHDRDNFPIEKFIKADKDVIAAIALKYGVNSVVLAHSRMSEAYIDVKLSPISSTGIPDSEGKIFTYNLLANESIMGLLYSSASDCVKKIPNIIGSLLVDKQVSSIKGGEANHKDSQKMSSFITKIPVKGLKDWIEIKSVLNGIKMLKPFSVLELRYDMVTIELYYKGDFKEFTRFLSQNGVNLKVEGGDWNLKME